MNKKWTKEETAIIIEHYPHSTPSQLKEMLPGRTAVAIHGRACVLKLKKSDEYIENTPNPGRFKKGFTPFTKGKKWADYMPEESAARCRSTQFKQGNKPPKYHPVGTEMVVAGYVYVKVADRVKANRYENWNLKHRMLWESVHGPIPKGCNIQFKDGNPLNITIDNLYMVSREEQMKVNSVMNMPDDAKRILYAIRVLTRQINKKEKYEQKH